MDVFRQRLEDEYDANVIITAPTVPYKGAYLRALFALSYSRLMPAYAVVYREKNGEKEVTISNPTDFPDVTDVNISKVKAVLEPIVKATIIVPHGMLTCFSVEHDR